MHDPDLLCFQVHYPIESGLGTSTHVGLKNAVRIRDSFNEYVNPDWSKAVIGLVVGNQDTILTFEPLIQYIVELENSVTYLDQCVDKAHRVIDDAIKQLKESLYDDTAP